MKTLLRRCVAALLVASIGGLNVPVRAEVISADTTPERARIIAVLDRADVRAQLAARGVDPSELEGRVAALTDEEAAQLAARIDQLPAGAMDPFSAAAMLVAMIVLVPVILVVGGLALVIGLITSARTAPDAQ